MLWNVSGISPATGWARFCLSVDPEADLSLEVWSDVETHFVDRNRCLHLLISNVWKLKLDGDTI